MRRLLWFGLGAGVGSYGTVRMRQLREQYPAKVAVRMAITAAPAAAAKLATSAGLRATGYIRARAHTTPPAELAPGSASAPAPAPVVPVPTMSGTRDAVS